MSFGFEVSKLALTDLDQIWIYTAHQWSKQQATKYYNEIFQTIHEICNNSELGASIDEIKKGHRRMNVKSHMILYKVVDSKIYIDRILHQKMDIEKHLND